MLDYVYTGLPPANTTTIGQAVFRGTTRSPNGRSVVARRDLLARRIDETAIAKPRARVLSIACGHLREAQCSTAVAERRIHEFVAFDQDGDSLEVVCREMGSAGIKAIQGSVMDIIRHRIAFSEFDFIYTAGLFDYLNDAVSQHLVSLMVEMLRPGGRLLVANFAPDNQGRDYMECFMDWFLICRDEARMAELIKIVEPSEIASWTVRRDSLGNVVYLEVEKTKAGQVAREIAACGTTYDMSKIELEC